MENGHDYVFDNFFSVFNFRLFIQFWFLNKMIMKKYLLAIDQGTTNGRAMIFDVEGSVAEAVLPGIQAIPGVIKVRKI